MVAIKLKYFNGRGLAESIRWVLAYAGAEYEDVRFEREQWAEEKPKTLTGMVPELEYDGFVLGESSAIITFLAKEFNLVGKDNREEARCAMIASLASDLLSKGRPVRYEQDPDKKKTMEDDYYNKTMPDFVNLIAKLLTQNGGKHLVGDEV